jgi:hypothetical protein
MTGPVCQPCEPEPTQLILDQTDKILHSSQFTGSDLLRNLLSYLAKRAVEHPGESAKEYELAVDVLGRATGFDPRLDSAVRVHTARLRAKLAEYYMSAGADDSVLLEVPKGAYLIAWHYRAGLEHAPAAPMTPVAPAVARPTLPQPQVWRWFAAGFAAAALAIGVCTAVWLSVRAPKIPAAIQTFWRPFLSAQPDPIVAFSNHRFAGTSNSGLRLFRDGVDPISALNDTYSGTGTVMAIHDLTTQFTAFGRSLRLKRAELLTWDEAQNTNLIVVGSPSANSRLRQLPPLQQFDFKAGRDEPRPGIAGIVNLHPRPGEEQIYFASGHPYTSDYAILAMLPGMKPGRRSLILAGTNTYGVQALGEFVSRADLVGELLSHLQVGRGGIPDFEALVEVKISDGVPVHSNLVLVRRR